MKDDTKTVLYIAASIAILITVIGFVFVKTNYNIVDDPRSTEEIIEELDPQTHCEEILGGTFIVESDDLSTCVIDE